MCRSHLGAGGLSVTALLALLLTACAVAERPDTNLAAARQAVESAGQTNATELAALELRQARDKLSQAEAALEREDRDAARRLADEARVDAQLAEAKAQAVSTEQAVAELQESIRTLQREIQRDSGAAEPVPQ